MHLGNTSPQFLWIPDTWAHLDMKCETIQTLSAAFSWHQVKTCSTMWPQLLSNLSQAAQITVYTCMKYEHEIKDYKTCCKCRKQWRKLVTTASSLNFLCISLSLFSSTLCVSPAFLHFSSLSVPLVYLIPLPPGNTALLFCLGRGDAETRSSPVFLFVRPHSVLLFRFEKVTNPTSLDQMNFFLFLTL